MNDAISSAVNAIKARLDVDFPKIVLVLGSGLGKFGETITSPTKIPYKDIPGFPVSTVPGHDGTLIVGKSADTSVACMKGRLHIYEGHPVNQIALPIRTFRALGAEVIVLTNAAGSLRRDMAAGSLMNICDHINFSGRNPLIGPNDDEMGPRFPDMSAVYDATLRDAMFAAADEEGIKLASGVYLYTTGPSFETPAEIEMFGRLGADAVGMSTVPEALVAVHAGMRVAGLSIITNLAAGISEEAITHDETLAAGAAAFDSVSRLMTRYLSSIAL